MLGKEGPQSGDVLRALRGDVSRLPGIVGHVVQLDLGLVGGGPKLSPLAQPQVSGANRATESFSARIDLDAVIASRSRGIGEGAGEALAVASGDGWQAGEIEKRGEDVDALHERRGRLAPAHAGGGNDQRDPGRLLVVGVLAPQTVVAEMPAVIAPQDHDRVVGETGVIEGVEEFAHLRIHEARGGVIAMDQTPRQGLVDGPLVGGILVLTKFTPVGGGIRGRTDRGHGRLRTGQGVGVVEVPVPLRGDERQMRAEEPHREEERLSGRGRRRPDSPHGLGGDPAVVVGFVVDPCALGGTAARKFFGRPALEAGFLAARPLVLGELVLHGLAPEERLVPAGLVVVIAVADMEDLAECRRVKAPVTEELRKRADRGRGATEVRRKVVDPERLGAESRQQRVSRR